jgi:hypothetical protein
MFEIPKLTKKSKPVHARAYLIWLAGSDKYEHLLDDDPRTVSYGPEVSEDDKKRLHKNMKHVHCIMEKQYGPGYWGFAWDIYGTFRDAREFMDEGYNAMSDPHDSAYKVLAACHGIVKGSVNQKPHEMSLTLTVLEHEENQRIR